MLKLTSKVSFLFKMTLKLLLAFFKNIFHLLPLNSNFQEKVVALMLFSTFFTRNCIALTLVYDQNYYLLWFRSNTDTATQIGDDTITNTKPDFREEIQLLIFSIIKGAIYQNLVSVVH